MISIQERLGIASDAIDEALWQWACMLRSAIPAYVVSFDPEKQTCTVQVAIREIVLKPPPYAKPTDPPIENIAVDEAIDPLQEVPIIMMRVPGWSLTFPIVPGTECLLIFADMCIDAWEQNSGLSPQADRRRHDLNDAFALFGPWSQPNKIPGYSNSSVQLRSDDLTVVISLNPSGVTITAPTINFVSPGVISITGKSVHVVSTDHDSSIDGKNFLLHTHDGVTTGGGVSGPVT